MFPTGGSSTGSTTTDRTGGMDWMQLEGMMRSKALSKSNAQPEVGSYNNMGLLASPSVGDYAGAFYVNSTGTSASNSYSLTDAMNSK